MEKEQIVVQKKIETILPNWERKNLLSILEQNFEASPDKIIFFDQKSSYTFKDFYIKVKEFAAKFIKMGIKEDDYVFLLMTPSIDLYALIYSIWMVKAKVVIVESFLTVSKLESIIDEYNPKILIYIKKYRNIVNILEETRTNFKRCELLALSEGNIENEDGILFSDADSDLESECLTIVERDKSRHLSQNNLLSFVDLIREVFPVNKEERIVTEYPLMVLAFMALGVPTQLFVKEDFSAGEIKLDKRDILYISKKTLFEMIKNGQKKDLSFPEKMYIEGLIFSEKTLLKIKDSLISNLNFVYSVSKGIPLAIRSLEEVETDLTKRIFLKKGIPIGRILDFWQPQLIQKEFHYFLKIKSLQRFDFDEKNSFEILDSTYFTSYEGRFYFCGHKGDEVYEDEKLIYPYQIIPRLEALNEIDHAAIVQYQEMSLGKTFALVIQKSLKGRKRHWSKIVKEVTEVLNEFDATPSQIIDTSEIPSQFEDPFDYDFKELRKGLLKNIKFHTQVKDDLFVILKGTIVRNQIVGAIIIFSFLYNFLLISFSNFNSKLTYSFFLREVVGSLGFWISIYNFVLFFISIYFLNRKNEKILAEDDRTDYSYKSLYSSFMNFLSIKKVKKLKIKDKVISVALITQIFLINFIIGKGPGLLLFILLPILIFGSVFNSLLYFKNRHLSKYLLKTGLFFLTIFPPTFALVGSKKIIEDFSLLFLGFGSFSIFLFFMVLKESKDLKFNSTKIYIERIKYFTLYSFLVSSLWLLSVLKITEIYHLGNNSYYIPVLSYLGMISSFSGIVGENTKKRIFVLRIVVSASILFTMVNLLAFSFLRS